MNTKIKIILKILLTIISFGVLYYLYSNHGDKGFGVKLYPIAILVFLVLARILSFWKYLIWSIVFMGSIGLILYGGVLSAKSTCAYVGCGINGAVIIAPIIVAITTGLLLLIQLIQYIIKRNKNKNSAGEIRYPYEIK